MSRLLIASPHRYGDLHRLWWHSLERHFLPAARDAGLEIRVQVYRDAPFSTDSRNQEFVDPAPGRRDFIEFYDSVLEEEEADLVFFVDADLFALDASPILSAVERLGIDDEVAAISMADRGHGPGVYALLLDRLSVTALTPPRIAPSWDDPAAWPGARNLQPAEELERRLVAAGKKVERSANDGLVDFHGTSVIRATRELIGRRLGDRTWIELCANKPYFLTSAIDNLLLGEVHAELFGEPFAPNEAGEALGGSLSRAELIDALNRVVDPAVEALLVAAFDRSEAKIERLSRSLGVAAPTTAGLLPRPRRWRGRARNLARRVMGRSGC